MRIAIGIVGVLLILAIVYFFLPQGLKTTVGALFRGNNTRISQNPSPSPTAFATPVATAIAPTIRPSVTPTVRTVASPSANAKATASATPRGTIATASGLPGTGIRDQSPEFIAIQVIGSIFLLLLGVRLSKHR